MTIGKMSSVPNNSIYWGNQILKIVLYQNNTKQKNMAFSHLDVPLVHDCFNFPSMSFQIKSTETLIFIQKYSWFCSHRTIHYNWSYRLIYSS